MLQCIQDVEFALLDHHLAPVEWVVLQLVIVFSFEGANVDVVFEHNDAAEVHVWLADHHGHLRLPFY